MVLKLRAVGAIQWYKERERIKKFGVIRKCIEVRIVSHCKCEYEVGIVSNRKENVTVKRKYTLHKLSIKVRDNVTYEGIRVGCRRSDLSCSKVILEESGVEVIKGNNVKRQRDV